MQLSNSISKTVNMPAQCPFCGRMFDYTLSPEIHIPGDSRLKKKVLDKTLFFPRCPHCGEKTKLKPGCIYLDENKKVLFIIANSPDAMLKKMMKTGDIRFSNIQSEGDLLDFVKGFYMRRIVYDVDAFREKILLSDYNYDDRIVELMKLSLSALLEKETHMPVYRIFLEKIEGSMLEFTAIMGKHAPFEYMTVESTESIYYQYRDKYLNKLGRLEEDEYITTDQKWAKKSGLLKNEGFEFVVPI